MYDLIVKNGILVLPEGPVTGSILVKDGTIVSITTDTVHEEAARTIDASGCYVFPGAIDPHSHLNDPGYTESEDFLTGTRSAAAGGFTTVLEMPISNPIPSSYELLKMKKEILEQKAVIDFGLWGSLINGNEKELPGIAEFGAVGVKAFLTEDPLYPAVNWGLIVQYMPWLERSGLLFALHCETPEINDAFLASLVQQQMNDPRCYSDSRPPISELVAVNTFAFLAKQYPKCRFYLVHASLAGSVDLSLAARAQGGQIYVETCPHYLAMTQQDLTRYGPFAVCNPPLRPKEEQDALWERMLAGKIDCIGSDHAPFLYAEKCQGKDRIWDAPPGFTGIQTCYPLLFQEAVQKRGMSVEQFAAVTSTNTAKLFGLYPQKGSLMVGTDADITVLDPNRTWTVAKEDLFYKEPWSPFIGWDISCKVASTVVRGNVVYDGSSVCVPAGFGQFIRPGDAQASHSSGR